ncbi:hypothetical protein MPTK1_5g12160 [Marchantia polymorpha subsp. ruderalis]|uniref:Apple domain-containing protein n=2 Tax=Marchantia polymorpha TaxID=3197 RepID=A0AAF6BHI7_MARPO|nr:hypothetical protein MARPO_0274s0005 [Marchantia polymorpha]BBN11471.1 hypothetical protein Mp_5g12160 [Marchantia polymorpha subsp. ruderalis]|eukprot:PTQ26906.1 hypothetical protein MARPO_0274s0005 [Marchantia polymorpha]
MARASMAVTLFTLLLLSESYSSRAGSCEQCVVYPYKDSYGHDLISSIDTLPAECADLCYITSSCVGFVMSASRDCWLKHTFQTADNLTDNGQKISVRAGSTNCQGLFTI